MRYIFVLTLVLLLLAGGCGKIRNGVDRNKTNANTDDISLPSDYPSEFPLPAGSRVLSVDISKDGTAVMFQTENSGVSVLEAYRKSAYAAGYEERRPEPGGQNGIKDNTAEFFRKSDNRNITVSVASGKNGKNIVSFTYK